MNTELKYNKIIAVPTLLFEETTATETRTGKQLPKDVVADDLYKLVSGARYAIKVTDEELKAYWVNSLEAYARDMVSNCATSVYVPTLRSDNLPKASDLKNIITPSLKKRILFIDQSTSIWSSIKTYLSPISEKISKNEKLSTSLNEVALGLYLLCLASKNHTEVVLSPINEINAINALKVGIRRGSEALARLSIIEGLFSLYQSKFEIPCIRFVADKRPINIAERIEEILEDTYLLEASKLRTFFSVKANVASIHRDLRKLLNFIVKNRKWAKGFLSVGSALGFSAYTTVPEKILNNLPENFQEPLSPACIDPKSHINNLHAGKNSYVVQITPQIFGSYIYSIYY